MKSDMVWCVTTEPPPSSGNTVADILGVDVGAAGAAALAAALEKNTSLQTLNLRCESLFLDVLLSDLLFLKELFLGVFL